MNQKEWAEYSVEFLGRVAGEQSEKPVEARDEKLINEGLRLCGMLYLNMGQAMMNRGERLLNQTLEEQLEAAGEELKALKLSLGETH